MTYVSLILALLRLVNLLVETAQQRRWMKAGEDAEIARAAESLHRKTEAGKKIWEKVDAMSESEVDAALRDLEPK